MNKRSNSQVKYLLKGEIAFDRFQNNVTINGVYSFTLYVNLAIIEPIL